MAVVGVLAFSWAEGRWDDEPPAGGQVGALAGRPTSVVIGLTDGARPSDGRSAAAADGAQGAAPGTVILAPGPDGVTGSDDDVLVPAAPRGAVPRRGAGPTTTVANPGDGRPTSPSTMPTRDPVRLRATGIDAPASAAAATDACVAPVRFATEHLVDGQASTAWRTDGDATGEVVTLALDGRPRISSVGLVPGFAQVDACDGSDRFAQNRRITTVTWLFDAGTSVVQDLRDAAELQSVAVPAGVASSRVALRTEGVTGDPERDFTAMSEIDVRGT